MELDALWGKVVAQVSQNVERNDVACWISTIEPRELRPGVLVAEVPSRLHVERVRASFHGEITRALSHLLGGDVTLALSVNGSLARAKAEPRPEPPPFWPAYTFEKFVVGTSNEIAYKSALDVTEAPGQRFNPLFLYGGVGLGKTHLATAIANRLARAVPRRRVTVLSAEVFANELIQSFRTNRAEAFRERFRTSDVLIIDDVQFFAGKERMQEEFFHTFNALYATRKQIVLASDQPPRDIPNLEDRLRSRFEAGLITDIEKPELPLRLAILARKAATIGFELPREVAQLIASKVVSSVRELEGALHRLVAACRLNGRTPDLSFAFDTLRPLFRARPPRTVEQVQRLVAERFRMSAQDLVCRKRTSRYAMPRQVAMYLARKGTKATYAEIAAGFGGRDHTTIMHAVKTVEARKTRDVEFSAMVESLAEKLQSA